MQNPIRFWILQGKRNIGNFCILCIISKINWNLSDQTIFWGSLHQSKRSNYPMNYSIIFKNNRTRQHLWSFLQLRQWNDMSSHWSSLFLRLQWIWLFHRLDIPTDSLPLGLYLSLISQLASRRPQVPQISPTRPHSAAKPIFIDHQRIFSSDDY